MELLKCFASEIGRPEQCHRVYFVVEAIHKLVFISFNFSQEN